MFWGKNPWQSHGFPRARRILKAIANDPERTMIVVDPRRTESADLADIHLRRRPGGDAHLLAALLKLLVDDGPRSTLARRQRQRARRPCSRTRSVDVADSCEKAGVAEAEVRGRARRSARDRRRLDLRGPRDPAGAALDAQQLPREAGRPAHRQLRRRGRDEPPHAVRVARRGRQAGRRAPTTPVTGHRLVTGLVPCNVIPDEILTDTRPLPGVLVEIGQPGALDRRQPADARGARRTRLVVVIDVALTETARQADYVLPAASQFEKWECTFFNLEFPRQRFHLRAPIFEPMAGTLPEYEIHSRLCRALGAYTDDDLAPLHAAAAAGRAQYADALFSFMAEHRQGASCCRSSCTRRSARRCRRPTASTRPERPRCGGSRRRPLASGTRRSAVPGSATRTEATRSATRCSTRSSPARPG